MLKNLLDNFARIIEFNSKGFNEELLENYIKKVQTAMNYTEATLRDLYARNIVSRNIEYYSKASIKSAALVGSVVVLNYYENSRTNKDKIQAWYLLQLINERSSKNTNNIVDELMQECTKNIEDIKKAINVQVKNIINTAPTFKNHMSSLWVLFWIQKKWIMTKNLTSQLEIDHIFPKKLLAKIYKRKQNKNQINNINNLALVDSSFNQKKGTKTIIELIKEDENWETQFKEYYTVTNDDEFYSDFKEETKSLVRKYKNWEKDKNNITKLTDSRNAFIALTNSRKQHIEKIL